uniref:Uncharacterized protein n=1 Tax=Picea glauca TaxID=3330 RepID=A0A101M4U0_PICGL|nr:hypothetical protein ABT39_MTgene970 [Picea glauca]
MVKGRAKARAEGKAGEPARAEGKAASLPVGATKQVAKVYSEPVEEEPIDPVAPPPSSVSSGMPPRIIYPLILFIRAEVGPPLAPNAFPNNLQNNIIKASL